LTALGFRWIPFDFSNCGTNPLRELKTISRLIALYRKERPTLVHHFTIKCVLYGSIAARLVGGISVVNAVTGMGHIFTDAGIKARLLRPVVNSLYRLALGFCASRVIFQNEQDRNIFCDAGLVPLKRTCLIRGSGVNCSKFVPSTGRKACEGSVKILFASRMLREKGVFELVAAASIIRKKGIHARFLFAGDIYPGNPSSLSAEELDGFSAAGIEYLGHVSDMPSLIDECDIVALPSYREGTPRILIEAAAMGKPIVATDIAGCRGLVCDGKSGYLVPVKNATALAEALEMLIYDDDLRQRFGQFGRQIVLDEFDEKIVIAETLELYGEVIPFGLHGMP
jgi:glycosyltransferase involved in cell wall biosynthesis